MAKQNGLVKLLGTIGDITYYKSLDGFLAKQKTIISAERIASDPGFRRTRENMAEFGNACTSGKTLRHALNDVLKNARDGRMVSRLCKTMMQVLKSDTVSPRGQRTVATGDLLLLKDFEFNGGTTLASTLYAPYTVSINRATGKVSIKLAPFVPSSSVTVPQGATHFELIAGVAAIDFASQSFVSAAMQSVLLACDADATAQTTLSLSISKGSTLPVFVALGIQFYQVVNGSRYPLTDKSFNALSLVAMNKP
jgi:hypothetical protein